MIVPHSKSLIYRQHLRLVDEFIFLDLRFPALQQWLHQLQAILTEQAAPPKVARWIVDMRAASILPSDLAAEKLPSAQLLGGFGQQMRLALLTSDADVFSLTLRCLRAWLDCPIHAKWFMAQGGQDPRCDAMTWVLGD